MAGPLSPPPTSDLWDKGKCTHACFFFKDSRPLPSSIRGCGYPGSPDHPRSPGGGAQASLGLASPVTLSIDALAAFGLENIILRWGCRLPWASPAS